MITIERPLFLPGKILTAEMLESLRDRPVSYHEIAFSRMPDGIIEGLDVIGEGNCIAVYPGLFKLNKAIVCSNEKQFVNLACSLYLI